jgi:uncharacterized protein involved in exopolysaccharide biosynthesis
LSNLLHHTDVNHDKRRNQSRHQPAAELARERARAEGKAERVDALREELNNLNQQKKALTDELVKFRDLDL